VSACQCFDQNWLWWRPFSCPVHDPLTRYQVEKGVVMTGIDTKLPVAASMEDIVNTIAVHDKKFLREEACRLKQRGGECWAIGEMVEKTCLLLDATNVGWSS